VYESFIVADDRGSCDGNVDLVGCRILKAEVRGWRSRFLPYKLRQAVEELLELIKGDCLFGEVPGSVA
jgi:hypothetical protein